MTFLRTDPFGFTWSTGLVSVAVRRIASWRRRPSDVGEALVVGLDVLDPDRPSKPLHRVEVYTSATGRSVRVFLDGEELRRG